MSFTINSAKGSAEAKKPCLLAEFVFPDGSVWRAATIACTYGGHDYEPALVEQNVERLAFLSEQGIDRIPSASLTIADPAGTLYATWERGADKGFRGATLVLRFALYDLIAAEWSTDYIIPFVGVCGQPSVNAEGMTVDAQNKLNLTVLQVPSAPISERCIWINPATDQQRTEAADANSRFYPCGETRDLGTAPPCSYTKQTCTVPLRFSGSTWLPAKSGEGRQYINSGDRLQWTNPDTSGKYRQFWPQWLGGSAWINAPVLGPWADGNFCRSEVAIGIGVVDVLRVIVNNVELTQGTTGDYRWHYVNHGTRDGAANTDTGYASGDPYGGLTVIQVLAPHSVIEPGSTPTVRILGRKATAAASISVVSATASGGLIRVEFGRVMGTSDPGDGTLVTISGNSWSEANRSAVLRYLDLPYDHAYLEGTNATGSGTGGTLYYDSSSLGSGGAIPTSWVLKAAYKASHRFSEADFGTSWTPAGALCNAAIPFTDGNGVESSQMRFSSAMALVERRSVSEIVRGLRSSIGARVYIGPDAKLEISIEGPLAEQQPAPVDGSNYDTPIGSTLRDGSSADGYIAYDFNFSTGTCSDLKRTSAGSNSTTPNRVVFPFSDPANDWAISTFSSVDPEDVSRMDQESPGGLQVQPEGVASYNHAYRISRLGLAKVLRGNPAGDTRGTDWWEWRDSFRAVRVQVGQIVRLYHPVWIPTPQLVRITGIKPSKNFETAVFTGHHHEDSWYADTPASLANPERTFYHFTFPGGPSAAPEFAVQASPLDPTVAQVLGLEFAANDANKTIKSGVFEFFYCDPTSPANQLEADLTLGASVIDTLTTSGLTDGDYVQIGREILKIGAPGASTAAQRAQLGSTADTAVIGDAVHVLKRLAVTVNLTGEFIASAELANWLLEQALPDMRLAAVTGRVTNDFGDSATTAVCLTDTGDGLSLTAPAPGGSGASVYQITNGTSSPSLSGSGTTGAPFQLPAEAQIDQVVATTQPVFLLLPTAASMVGVSITVKVAAGSDESVWLRPQSGQNIEGSGSDYEIADPGSVTITAIDATHWVITSMAGSLTAPPAANAPNVLSVGTTVAVVYQPYGHDWRMAFQVTVALPVLDANYSHLKQINPKCTQLADLITAPLFQADWSGNSVTFLSKSFPLAAGSFDIVFEVLNEDGVKTSSPTTKTATANAPTLNNTQTAADRPDLRYQYGLNSPRTVLESVPSVADGQYPLTLTAWRNEGTGQKWTGWFVQPSAGAAILIGAQGSSSEGDIIPPTNGAASWTLTWAIGAIDSTAAIPAGAKTTGSFTVQPPGTWSSAAVTGIVPPTPTYAGGSGGAQMFGWPELRLQGVPWTDKDFFYVRLYLQTGHYATPGNPATFTAGGVHAVRLSVGDWAADNDHQANFSRSGNDIICANPNWWNVPSDGEIVHRFQWVMASRLNGGTETIQSKWPGNASYYDLVVDGTKSHSDARLIDPTTLGSGLWQDPADGKPLVGTGDNPGNMLTNGNFDRSVLGASCLGWTLDAAAYPVLAGITPPYALRLTGLVNTYARQTRKFTVNPGQLYYAQVEWISEVSADGAIGLAVDYFDSADAYVSSDSVSVAATSITAWTKTGLACTVPTGATRAQYRINAYSSTTGDFLVDNCLFRPQATTGHGTVPDGKGGVRLNTGNLSNLLFNGGFENALTPWSKLNGTEIGLQSGAFAFSGSNYFLDSMVSGGGIQQAGISCRAGDEFYAECYLNAGFGTISGSVFLSLAFRDAAGAGLTNPFAAVALSAGMGWTKLSVSGTAPAGASSVVVTVQIGTASGTGYWYVDNVFLARQTPTGPGTEPDGKGGVQVKIDSSAPVTTDADGNVTLKLTSGLGTDGSGNLKVKNGQGITFDGSGNVVPNAGPGLTFNAGGALVPNQGATVGVNPSGQLIVPAGSLGKAEFGNGFEPYAVYFGLPGGGAYTAAPNVIINSATSPWSLWKKHGGGWRELLKPEDIVAGTITALVSLISPSISGGSIAGTSYTLTSGTQTLTLSVAGAGGILGIHVSDSSSGRTITINKDYVQLYTTSGNQTTTFGHGGITISKRDGSGNTAISLDATQGTLSLFGSFPGVWVNGVQKI